MRVKLSDYDRSGLFSSLQNKLGILDAIAAHVGVSRRTLSDWRKGKFLMPIETFEKLADLAKLSGEISPLEILPEFWNAPNSARKGALARIKLYGSLGTPEGRRKGGLTAVKTHRKNGNSRFTGLKKIHEPEHSEQLAEFMGIMMGDGHLAERQASMCTNSLTDIQHAHFVAEMFQELFDVKAVLIFKKNQNAVEIIASSTALVDHIHKLGMPRGDKIAGGISIPVWISQDEDYQKAFLRGLFDTDGCIYLDKHIIKGKTYRNIGWTITSYADTLRAEVHETLRTLGFSPTLTDPHLSVFLRRKHDIRRYFEEIGTHNDKHRNRYQSFLDQRGGVA